MRPPKQLVDAVVASLEKGDGWDFGEYRANHRAAGIEVWTGNSYYGVHLRTPEAMYGYVATFGFLSPWRRRLLKAARRASAKSSTSRLNMYRQRLGVA